MEDLFTQLQAALTGAWNHRRTAAIIMWTLALAGWLRVYTLPDDFQATARVFVDTQSILKPLLAGMTTVPNVEQQVAIMSRTLMSRPNVERLIRMTDMDIGTQSARDHEQLVDELVKRIHISSTGSYDIYTISYNNRNPKLVRDVVQSLLTIFVEGSFKGKKGESQKAVQFLDEQIKSYEERLLSAENSLKEFKLRNSNLLPRQGSDYAAQLANAADALSGARLDLAEAEQGRNAIKAQVSGDEPVFSQELAAPTVQDPELDARIAALNKSLDALTMQYTEAHPDIVAARRLAAQLQQKKMELAKAKLPEGDPAKNYSPMLQQLKVALTEADARVAAMRTRVQEYTARHARLLAQLNAVPEVESQLAQLNRDYLINKDNYEKLIGKREAAKLSGDLSNTTEMMTFRIIDPPILPAAPIGPNRQLLYSLVFGLALLAGPAVAVVLAQANPAFHGPAAMRSATGFPVLGTVAMNWSGPERHRVRRSRLLALLSVACMTISYALVMTSALLAA